MAVRIAINGFGRIGRCVLRAGWNNPEIEFVHINDLTSDDMLAYLLENDTVHGRFEEKVTAVEGGLKVGERFVATSKEPDPAKLPWGDKQIDVVLECTGRFTDAAQARVHLTAGARKVIISAPAKNVDATFVVGVNDHEYDASKHHIVSNASCTTNCLAPVVKALHEAIGIEHGLVTTVHSYTMDQNLLDAPHKGDFRRARAAGQNMVPSSTGAAKAIGEVYPVLKGKLNGVAVRVPTPNVSVVDLVFTASRPTTVDEVNAALVAAATTGPLAAVFDARHAAIVSSDIKGDAASSVADLDLTQVIAGTMVKVFSWYDNEWGFSNRMLDLAMRLGGA